MQELRDFTSLVQMGAGVTFALAIFFRPLDRQAEKCIKILDDKVTIERGRKKVSDEAIRSYYNSREIDLDNLVLDARGQVKVPSLLVGLGIVLNLWFLIVCTLIPASLVNTTWGIWIALMSIVPYVVGYAWIEMLTRRMTVHFTRKVNQTITSLSNNAP